MSHAPSRPVWGLLTGTLFMLTSCIVDTADPLEFGMQVSPSGEIAIAPLWCEARPAQTVEAEVRAVTNDGVVLPPVVSGPVEVRFQEFTSLGTIPHELLVEAPSIDGVPIRSITTRTSSLGGSIVDLVSIRDDTKPGYYFGQKRYDTAQQLFASRCPSS